MRNDRLPAVPVLTEADFRKAIKTGLSGGYLLFGAEEYLKEGDVRLAKAALSPDESFDVFNSVTFYAPDYESPGGSSSLPSALADTLPSPPMMADKKIVTVLHYTLPATAKKPKGKEDGAGGPLEELLGVLSSLRDYDYNVLLLCLTPESSAGLENTAAYRLLCEYLTPVRFDAPAGTALFRWLCRHFEHNGVACSEDALNALVSFCGTSMQRLASEADKLSFYTLSHGRKEVDRADIPNVCGRDMSLDSFALSNALLENRPQKALEVLELLRLQKAEPTAVLAEIGASFADMLEIRLLLDEGRSVSEIASALGKNEYPVRLKARAVSGIGAGKLRRAVLLWREADRSLKSSPGTFAPIEQFICSL